ncbi:MAG TPA: ZIP family metal transporter, partial [Solirubrobacterales bacterium]|nr:ZIP family metal transporter [Solirubrobacterales bacterium]
MEAAERTERAPGGLPAWALGLVPLVLIAAAIGAFAALGGPGLGEREGPPVEDVAVERTVLRPGAIELTLRNDGPDPVEIAQVAVNDGYTPFTTSDGAEIGRLDSTTLEIAYPWVEGEAYEIFALTSAGGTIEAEIPVAAETPDADLGFFGLMALLGIYVGVIPVSLGMLWLPFVRRVDRRWIAGLIAFTVGLLAFLAIDAGLEGFEIANEAPSAFGGSGLVFVGALAAYLLLAGVDAWLSGRREAARPAAAGGAATLGGFYFGLLVAIGIGLHNLGEGLAIGSAYASGALALGAFLVVGFAIHNTTEGLAIV